jgi:hypothetical protein
MSTVHLKSGSETAKRKKLFKQTTSSKRFQAMRRAFLKDDEFKKGVLLKTAQTVTGTNGNRGVETDLYNQGMHSMKAKCK